MRNFSHIAAHRKMFFFFFVPAFHIVFDVVAKSWSALKPSSNGEELIEFSIFHPLALFFAFLYELRRGEREKNLNKNRFSI
jgi:hypothetical protein